MAGVGANGASEPKRCIAVARARGSSALNALLAAATNAGHQVQVFDSSELAAAEAMTADRVDCLILAAPTGSESRQYLQLARDVERLQATLPRVAQLVVGEKPDGALVSTAFRSGAFDFIDTTGAPPDLLAAAIERAAGETSVRVQREASLTQLRSTVEEFLRILVRTERRTIDLEQQLRAATLEADDDSSGGLLAIRPPRVLIVDDDDELAEYLEHELRDAGLDVSACGTGNDALDLAKQLSAAGKSIDLALVDKNLPDGSGLDIISALRNGGVGPPAMLMTGFASAESAIDAADLGVAGYLTKPFDDIDALIERVKHVAGARVTQQRERTYLWRIKQRHSEFLLRYRKLAAQLDKLL